jgi:hypothetical protein
MVTPRQSLPLGSPRPSAAMPASVSIWRDLTWGNLEVLQCLKRAVLSCEHHTLNEQEDKP